MQNIKTMILGAMQTNCYVVYDTESLSTIIVDPSIDENSKLPKFIEENGLKPVAILITHAHFDHIGSVDLLRERYLIKAYSSKIEVENALNTKTNLCNTFTRELNITATIDEIVVDGQTLELGGIEVNCIEVPGHSDQSICYYINKIKSLISGDTVFCGDTGRTDFYNGPATDLMNNIREKLFVLPGETNVYPGHGPATTIAREMKNSINIYEEW